MPEDEGAADRGSGTRRRGRGQPALAKLVSTADFTNKRKLPPDDRKMILFLLVALADAGDGVLTPAYQAVLARHGDTAGHWSAGKNMAAMQKAGGKFLGQSAERRPSWDKVEDLIGAMFGGPRRQSLLAVAAGLFRADGEPPSASYGGEIVRPEWAAADVVTVETIRQYIAGLPDDRPVPVPPPDVESDLRTENKNLKAENNKLWLMLHSVLRAFRVHDGELKERDRAELREKMRLRVKAVESDEALKAENERLIWAPFLVASHGSQIPAEGWTSGIVGPPPAGTTPADQAAPGLSQTSRVEQGWSSTRW
ncbi:hypothetical protein JOF56_011450 [Kibdelosporangium banguiense]|uniref:Uncharacterized protein n=1 Tax=Kibdelosporangium banguiense TaxID=1365924 RepID=A0ABS4U317_9PSEU|nr:hypothetical protein [Kibdelosporangium banguiense]MBP2331065.1 hypothetical protein [Kibdelosporangium banguiense]